MTDSATETQVADTSNPTFRAIADAEMLQRSVALVGAVVDECRVSLDEDGIRIRAMDPATVAAVDLEVASEAFETYETSGGRIGVDLARLGDVVDMADRDQRIRLELDAETRTLRVTIDDLDYTLALVDPEAIRSPPDVSDLRSDAAGEVVVPAADFDRAVRAADMVADHVAFGIDDEEETFYVEADGDTDDVSLVQSADDLVEFAPADAHSLFSIDYLEAINRETPSDAAVGLELGTEMPLAAGYEFADGGGSVEYFVSPRIART